jgi:asparagine synthase (glutamine-hydrolysing)
MLRYVAFSWDRRSPQQAVAARRLAARLQACSSEWQVAFSQEGLSVMYAGARLDSSELCILKGGAGVILGTLFERPGALEDESLPRRAVPTSIEVADIVASAGRRLITSFWGSYIAFVCDRERDRSWVVRAPMNAPLCLMATSGGVRILFSNLEDCISLGVHRFSVNWRYLAGRLALGMPLFGATGLKEVAELGLGECLQLDADNPSHDLYWDPVAIAGSDIVDDYQLAVRALRGTTLACIHAWASCHRNILVRLSGGLDSSILVACLRHSPTKPSVTSFHHFWPGPLGDERKFARLAAQRAGFELIEVERAREYKLDSVLESPISPTPLDAGLLRGARADIALARERGASAVFCGTIGDALFHYAPAMPAAAEYLSRHGVNSGFVSTAFDVARLENTLVWKVLQNALRDGLLKKPSAFWSPSPLSVQLAKDDRLVTNEVVRELEQHRTSFVHPWLHRVDGVPFGKLWQIRLLPFDVYWRNCWTRPDDAQSIPPFVSQPLAELCLRIPTYLHTRNGWDRSVARQSFAQDLPEEIRNRTTKGSPDMWLRDLIEKNSSLIRELLLDGVLVKEKLLDRRKVEDAMPGVATKTRCPVGAIIQHVSTEIWLRRWTGTQYAVAA